MKEAPTAKVIRYQMSLRDYRDCVSWADRRWSLRGDVIDRFVSKKLNAQDSHVAGCVGELGVHRYWGGVLVQSDVPDRHNPDLWINGCGVEVKARTFDEEGLVFILSDAEKIPGRIYAFVRIIGFTTLELYPPMPLEAFERSLAKRNMGHGPCWTIGEEVVRQIAYNEGYDVLLAWDRTTTVGKRDLALVERVLA